MTYDIIEEPCNGDYVQLITFCAARASTGLVVVSEPQALAPTALRFLQALSPFSVETKAASEWPGTKLFGRSSWVYRFRVDIDSCELIIRAAGRLYDWVEPNLPEDLCLLRRSADPILVTISHESDAYLQLEQGEAAELQSRFSHEIIRVRS